MSSVIADEIIQGLRVRGLEPTSVIHGAGFLDLQITREADRDVLYLGLDKGGVYELRIGH